VGFESRFNFLNFQGGAVEVLTDVIGLSVVEVCTALGVVVKGT
jgi:hypothetical protein